LHGAQRTLAGPVRTCLGCRKRDLRSVLLRVSWLTPAPRWSSIRIAAAPDEVRGCTSIRVVSISPSAVRRSLVPSGTRGASTWLPCGGTSRSAGTSRARRMAPTA